MFKAAKAVTVKSWLLIISYIHVTLCYLCCRPCMQESYNNTAVSHRVNWSIAITIIYQEVKVVSI